MADIKEKIKKLLALGQSPNEHEAKDALLKARALMAKHKLSEGDFKEEDKLVHQRCEEISWTTDSGHIWMTTLCKVIADNYCCSAAWYTPKGTRTHILVLTGFSEDMEICRSVIRYTTAYVLKRVHKMQATSGKSYADGFTMGLQFAYEDQNNDNPDWALVVQKPQDVQNYEAGLKTKNVKTKKVNFDPLSYLKGQNDGMRFNEKKTIEGEVV